MKTRGFVSGLLSVAAVTLISLAAGKVHAATLVEQAKDLNDPGQFTATQVLPDGISHCKGGYSGGRERIGVMSSTDGGVDWSFQGHVCFHSSSIIPVDPSATRIKGGIALYFPDLASFNKRESPERIIYRVESKDGVKFGERESVYETSDHAITDPYVLRLRGGRYVMFVHDNNLDGKTRVLVSPDGFKFRDAGTVPIPAAIPGALQFPDGRVRVFGCYTNQQGEAGIYSWTSPDGLKEFTQDKKGPSIPGSSSNLVCDPHPIQVNSGKYLMAYKVRPAGPAAGPFNDEIHIAVSADGLNWVPGTNLKKKIRSWNSKKTLITSGSVPSLVELADGTLLMHYVDFTKENKGFEDVVAVAGAVHSPADEIALRMEAGTPLIPDDFQDNLEISLPVEPFDGHVETRTESKCAIVNQKMPFYNTDKQTTQTLRKAVGIKGSDLGASFTHEGHVYFLFGDTPYKKEHSPENEQSSVSEDDSDGHCSSSDDEDTPGTSGLGYEAIGRTQAVSLNSKGCFEIEEFVQNAQEPYIYESRKAAQRANENKLIKHGHFQVPVGGFSRDRQAMNITHKIAAHMYAFFNVDTFHWYINNKGKVVKIDCPKDAVPKKAAQRVRKRTILVKSEDEGKSWYYVSDLQDVDVAYNLGLKGSKWSDATGVDKTPRFTNVAPVVIHPQMIPSLEKDLSRNGRDASTVKRVLLIWGSGRYRESHPYFAYTVLQDVESCTPDQQDSTRCRADSFRYFKGFSNGDNAGLPEFTHKMDNAAPIFNYPCFGNFSVLYLESIGKWAMTYDCKLDTGAGKRTKAGAGRIERRIEMRLADQPWGPWSEPLTIYDKSRGITDNIVNPKQGDKDSGTVYGAYLIDRFSNSGVRVESNLVFPIGSTGTEPPPHFDAVQHVLLDGNLNYLVSTWKPYQVVLMNTTFMLKEPAGRLQSNVEEIDFQNHAGKKTLILTAQGGTVPLGRMEIDSGHRRKFAIRERPFGCMKKILFEGDSCSMDIEYQPGKGEPVDLESNIRSKLRITFENWVLVEIPLIGRQSASIAQDNPGEKWDDARNKNHAIDIAAGKAIDIFAGSAENDVAGEVNVNTNELPDVIPRSKLRTKPNIIVFVADDVGVDRIKSYSRISGPTPNIDALASNGVRFTSAWTSPVCSPTRASLLTGKYPFRHDVGAVVKKQSTPDMSIQPGLDLSEHKTIPKILDDYTSVALGKWHINNETGKGQGITHPLRAGFDYYAGLMGNVKEFLYCDDSDGQGTYKMWEKIVCEKTKAGISEECAEIYKKGIKGRGNLPLSITLCDTVTSSGKKRGPMIMERYATTDIVEDAIERIKAFEAGDGADHLFMYVSFSAAHVPYHKPPDKSLLGPGADLTHFKQCSVKPDDCDSLDCPQRSCSDLSLCEQPNCSTPGKSGTCNDCKARRTWAAHCQKAMIQAMDHGIGRIVAAAPRNTVFIFMGDNGSDHLATTGNYEPLHAKGTVFEGGIHVPLIVSGAAVSDEARGKTSGALVHAIDLFATVADLAGADIDFKTPSQTLMPYVNDPEHALGRETLYTERFTSDKKPAPEKWLYHQAARDSQYKLLRCHFREAGKKKQTDELFFDLTAKNNHHEGEPLDIHSLSAEQKHAYNRLVSEIEGKGRKRKFPSNSQ